MVFLQSRNLIVAAAIVVGCGIAAMVVAHDRGSNTATPQPPANVAGLNNQPAYQPYSQPYNQAPQPVYAQSQPYGPSQAPYYSQQQATPVQAYAYGAQPYADTGQPDDGYYPVVGRPVYVRPPTEAYAAPPVAPAPVYSNRRVVYETRRGRREHYHHHRSKAHSAEIVAGSAGVGAAIGAIAGGGKGAGIGALAGGAGGFIYDRLTH
jgi:hypothetical protein